MWNKLKLAPKFILLLSLVFLGSIIISGIILSQALENKAEDELTRQGFVLIATVNSVRKYTNTHINPLLKPQLETSPDFIPEAIPSYSVREVFEILRKNKEYASFFYKDATLNPTNLRDKADEFETELVQRFRQNSELKEEHGFRTILGNKVFYISRPFVIKDESCLRCHSTPEAAPRNQIKKYGSEHGFGWKLNEIVAAQVIYTPSNEVFAIAHNSLYLIGEIFLGVFGLAIVIINFLLKKTVIQPIKPISDLAQKMSAAPTGADEQQKLNPESLRVVARRSDELGQLARLFQCMALEVIAREQRLQQQLLDLRGKIDQSKNVRSGGNNADMDYIKALQRKAKTLRSKKDNS